MGGKLTNEGANNASTVWIKNGTQRGADSLYIGLYEDSVEPTVTATLGSITEASGSGYARIQLLDADFTVDSTGLATNLQKTFTAGADWDPIYGYFITDGTLLLFVEHLSIGPITVLNGLTFKHTPKITAGFIP